MARPVARTRTQASRGRAVSGAMAGGQPGGNWRQVRAKRCQLELCLYTGVLLVLLRRGHHLDMSVCSFRVNSQGGPGKYN